VMACGLKRTKSELEAFLRKRHCRALRPSLMRSTHSGESFASEIRTSAAKVLLQGGKHLAGHRQGDIARRRPSPILKIFSLTGYSPDS